MTRFTNSLFEKRIPYFLGITSSVGLSAGFLFGQGSPVYPYVNPTAAASGMTSGLENGSTSGTINMMQVRASAQDADRAAAAAAMARTAESAIEERNLKTALQKARETRQAKINASERLKWQRATAYNAYNKVSVSEMSTWKDPQGNVKIGKDLPSDFVRSVKAEEAARAAAEPKKKGFSPLKNIGSTVSRAVGIEEPASDTGLSMPKPLPPAPAASTRETGRGFSFNPPKLKFGFPKIGNRQKSNSPPPEASPPTLAQPAPEPPQQTRSRNVAASASASPAARASAKPAPARKPADRPVTITKSRSGAEMVRSSQGNETPAASPPPQPVPAIGNTTKSTGGGLFSKNRPPSSDKKLFGFGKKTSEPAPIVSNSLFPDASVPSQPAGTYSSAPPKPASSEQTTVSLPNSQPAPKKRFSLPKPKLSIPGSKPDSGGVSPTSTRNRNGNNFYVVNSSSQFMKYGKTRSETSIYAVGPGTVVMMTKPGDEWAAVQLQDGSSGVIQTKNLRGASPSEIPSNFAPARANYATQMQEQIQRN